jgi:hypothetical protein
LDCFKWRDCPEALNLSENNRRTHFEFKERFSGLDKNGCHGKQGGYHDNHRAGNRKDLLEFIVGKLAH